MFSTLHTNDAPSAFTRLIDMGVEPFLVSQHGRRRDGPAAGADDLPGVQDRVRAGPRRGADATSPAWPRSKPPTKLWQGRRLPGVPPDRLPRPDRHLRADGDRATRSRSWWCSAINAGVIRNEALKDGMITLRQDGWRKVLHGHDDDRRSGPRDGGGY